MGNTAPKCRAPGVDCGNRTWHPTGMCHLHVNATAPQGTAQTPRFGGATPQSPSYSYGANPSEPQAIMDAARDAFPDLDDEVHPRSLRQQVVSTLQSAVSIEAYRCFPQTADVEQSTRNEMLEINYRNITQSLVPSPVTLTDAEAGMISRSSEDSFGRGMDESRALASYGLRKEWELGRSLGFDNDENGVPYSADFSQYCGNNQRYFSRVVGDEFVRQMNHYDDIVVDVRGRQFHSEPNPAFADAPTQYGYAPQQETPAPRGGGGDLKGEAASALKEMGKAFGRWSVNQVRDTPRRVNNMREDARARDEEIRRRMREREDRIIREEEVHRAKAARRRRTGIPW